MTSFLDLDIDWQGIKEVNEKDKESAKKYLNAILEKKSENYYCQKLVNLWFYLTGNKDLNIDEVTTSLEKDKLPYKKSVLDLINELDNEKKK
jgi:lipoprotein NlpI